MWRKLYFYDRFRLELLEQIIMFLIVTSYFMVLILHFIFFSTLISIKPYKIDIDKRYCFIIIILFSHIMERLYFQIIIFCRIIVMISLVITMWIRFFLFDRLWKLKPIKILLHWVKWKRTTNNTAIIYKLCAVMFYTRTIDWKTEKTQPYCFHNLILTEAKLYKIEHNTTQPANTPNLFRRVVIRMSVFLIDVDTIYLVPNESVW